MHHFFNLLKNYGSNDGLTLCLLISSRRCHEMPRHHLGPAFSLYQNQLSLDLYQNPPGCYLVLNPNGQIVAHVGNIGPVLSPELAGGERTNQIENLKNANHVEINNY